MECLSRKDCVDRLESIRKEYGLDQLGETVSDHDVIKETESRRSSLNLSKTLLRSKSSFLKSVTSVYAQYNKALVVPSFLYKR